MLIFPAGGGRTVVGKCSFTLAGFSGDITGTSTSIATMGDCVTTPLTSDTQLAVVHIAT